MVTWGRTAEAVAQHVHKGRQVGVEGELRVSEWPPDTGPRPHDVKVTPRRVDFLVKPRQRRRPRTGRRRQLSIPGLALVPPPRRQRHRWL